MKFRDIPNINIKPYAYSVSVGWDELPLWIKRHEDLNLNPDYQRGHVWSEDQQSAYLEYILKGGISGKDTYFNCKGWMNTFEGPFELVDGLQRITAILKFMNNEVTVFGNYFRDYEDYLPFDCHLNININNLDTRRDVLLWYINLNQGGVVHTKEEIDRVYQLLNLVRD